MKCPKCGYHSFDYLDRCKKCSNDLTAFKSKFHLRSLIFPQRAELGAMPPTPPTVPLISDDVAVAVVAAPVSVAAATDFGFDFMDETPSAAVQPPSTPAAELPMTEPTVAAPFSWDDAPLGNEPPASAAAPVVLGDTEAFDWNDGDEEPANDASETTAVDEEPATDDSFGLDLSWDTELPPLDDAVELEDAAGTPETDVLSDWDFEEEPPPLEAQSPKAKQQEQPRDPFESREPSVVNSAPVSTHRELAPAPEAELAATQFDMILTEDDSPPPQLAELPSATTPAVANLAQPAADFPDRPAPREPVPAVWSRGLALGVDLMLLTGAILLFMMAGQKALAPADSRPLLPTLEHLLLMAIPYFLVLFSLSFGYFTLFHFLTGQTPGKMLLRLRVETEEGSPLNFSHAFLRSTGGLFSLLAGGVGFLGIVFGPERRGWNDRLAGTLVVTAHPGEPPNPLETDDP